MSSFSHKGTTITLDGNGAFRATHKGEVVRGPSLDAVKKKINAIDAKGFVEFDALNFIWGNKLGEFRVVGVQPGKKGSWRNANAKWKVTDKNKTSPTVDTSRVVIPDTPENRVKVQAYLTRLSAIIQQEEQLKQEREKSYSDLPWANPDDHTPGGEK